MNQLDAALARAYEADRLSALRRPARRAGVVRRSLPAALRRGDRL